jgi:hypothetical protein
MLREAASISTSRTIRLVVHAQHAEEHRGAHA